MWGNYIFVCTNSQEFVNRLSEAGTNYLVIQLNYIDNTKKLTYFII